MTEPKTLAERTAQELAFRMIEPDLIPAIAEFVLAADAQQRLLVCYRLRRRPTEKLLDAAGRYDAALAALAKALGVE